MRIRNIDRVLVFREVGTEVYTLGRIAREYPIEPGGTLNYFGFVPENVEHFRKKKKALRKHHRAALDDVLAWLAARDLDEATFLLAVQPSSGAYDLVTTNMPLVERLANELHAYQAAAGAAGKRLNLVVRYASEMNDVGGAAYVEPSTFRSSFTAVRRAFRERAPHVLFSFSPALRADIVVPWIAEYWPGDEHVDVIGATWYVHGEAQRDQGMARMREYFLDPPTTGKPFAIDEFGGALGGDGVYRDNDAMLRAMLNEMEALQIQNVSFKYGTIFLDGKKYGADATLRFLRAPR